MSDRSEFVGRFVTKFAQQEAAPQPAAPQVDAPTMLRGVLATLLAMRQAYHSAHWQAGGPTFEADHALFLRLYESVGGEIDMLAEKMVDTFGPPVVAAGDLSAEQARVVSGWVGSNSDPFRMGLAAEEQLQQQIRQAYESLKGAGTLSLGMDDFLMAMASNHETNHYLLSRRLASRTL